VICRRFRAEDKADVLALLRTSFDGWHGERSEAYWEWKFEHNPHGRALIWVSDDGGRIAGCYIWIPTQVRFGDETILGAQSVDAAVDPAYRGRGVFSDLARMAVEESEENAIELVFAFPTEGAFKGQIRVGFEPRTPITRAYRLLAFTPLRRRRSPGLTVRRLETFDAGFDPFASRRSDQLSIRRDPAYLEWRYRGNPVRRYETIVCEREGAVCGYAVLSVDRARGRITPGYVVDLQVLPGVDAAAACLTSQALRQLRQLGAHVAVAWTRPSGPEQEALQSFGFSTLYESLRRRLKPSEFSGQFIVLEHAGRLRDLLAGQPPWALVPGDADYV
jgi:GNAT superfamily N-acetyltransferase